MHFTFTWHYQQEHKYFFSRITWCAGSPSNLSHWDTTGTVISCLSTNSEQIFFKSQDVDKARTPRRSPEDKGKEIEKTDDKGKEKEVEKDSVTTHEGEDTEREKAHKDKEKSKVLFDKRFQERAILLLSALPSLGLHYKSIQYHFPISKVTTLVSPLISFTEHACIPLFWKFVQVIWNPSLLTQILGKVGWRKVFKYFAPGAELVCNFSIRRGTRHLASSWPTQLHSESPNHSWIARKLKYFLNHAQAGAKNPFCALRSLEALSLFPEKWAAFEKSGEYETNYFWGTIIHGLCNYVRTGVKDISRASSQLL